MGWAFRHQYELILVLEKGKPKYNLKDFSDVQSASHINHNELTKIINHSSKKGDLILDPFCGSGSVCVACQETGRKWIGIDIEDKWVEVARERIERI